MKLSIINPKYYYAEFKKFLSYTLKPTYMYSSQDLVLQKARGTWAMFVIKTILTVVIGIAVTFIYNPINKTAINWSEQFSTLKIFFLSIILFPLLEEIGFRLSIKFKPIFLSLTLGVLSYNIISKALYQTNLSNTNDHFTTRLWVSILIILISYPIISQHKIKMTLAAFWKANFRWIFYFFCITFAWMHIFNYGITLKHILLIPLITLPKLISSLSYAYIRMHYGFVYSLGFHMCWNSIGFIMSLFPAIGTD